ncbi:bactofilin family protein [Cohnella thailandensis]|uniref:Polymer-forming cytoskeletal protein n=1 Tax=Cohnella thailandensis TaxID=557557 RepID=A0A841T677_9BACL|nr:polymer-forming cytoskeletal protein [Cohnella thailandensis]MBB6638195.1 polymer-forming cytoskeletal protein [Cohnella thailandensis]MBP1977753.1 cytoskeletal protein CcmA (bactofilin family) [Cohnella thailandensis]
MIGKKSKLDPSKTDTLIGEGTVFDGKISSQASIRLEGEVNGDIDCEGDVIIGEKGLARSNVTARDIVLAGRIAGNVTAKGKLIIKSSGVLQGDLQAAELSVEPGGVLHGTSRMEIKGVAEPAPAAAIPQSSAV